MARSKPSQAESERRKTVNINAETVTNITSTDFPGHHPAEDAAWSLDKFRQNLKIDFHQNDLHDASFSLVGIDASIANAFRRILLAEVPTLAIETCYFMDNGSVIADEVLAHRLGLVPLKGDVQALDWLRWYIKPQPENGIAGTDPVDYNTVVLKLQVKCEWRTGLPKDLGGLSAEEKFINSSVYSRDIKWEPQGQQDTKFANGPIEPVSPDILLAKLRPGQEIDITMHAVKGVGADHAKFSPVGTATYRLMPKIDILKPIIGEDAKKFQKCFPKGVIELERVTAKDTATDPAYKGHEGDEKAVVRDPARDTVSRECLRHDEFKDKVKLGRVQDHFIYSIESTGQYPSDLLFLKSVDVLKQKATRLLTALDRLNT